MAIAWPDCLRHRPTAQTHHRLARNFKFSPCGGYVPAASNHADLTFFGRINLNANIALQPHANPIQRNDRTLPAVRAYLKAKPLTIIFRSAASLLNDLAMRLPALSNEAMDTDPQPSWATVWHLWTLLVPRQSIDGSRVWGRVWRRHDGYRWIYKRIVHIEELH